MLGLQQPQCMNKLAFKEGVGALFAEAGFKRKGAVWGRTGTDVVVFFRMTKSDLAQTFYLDFGLHLGSVDGTSYPSVHRCEINGRIDGLFREQRSLIAEACMLERAEQLFPDLLDFLRSAALPFLLDCMSMGRVRDHYLDGRFSGVLVSKTAKDKLAVFARHGA